MIELDSFARFALDAINTGPLPKTPATSATVQLLLNIFFGLIGALSFLFVCIAGFRYTISRGNPQDVAKAKNTIIYALIGLVVAIGGISVVNFIITKIA